MRRCRCIMNGFISFEMVALKFPLVFVFLGLVGAQSPTMAPTSGGCLSGWAEFGNNCYFMSPGVMYKSACDTYCPGLKSGATLLCVMNSAENSFLAAMITNAGVSYAFTGLNDVAQEGTFAWPAGCLSTYSVPWETGEPNGGYSENYSFMQPDGKFVDTGNNQLNCPCQYSLPVPSTVTPSINPSLSPSEAPVATPTLIPTARPTGICPYNWPQLGNKCYTKADQYMLHDACVSYCAALRPDATLPCIESAEENQFLLQRFTAPSWIGFNDVAAEGTFAWPAGCASSYVHWGSGEPNEGAAGDYVRMASNGYWQDVPDQLSVCQCELSAVHPTIAPTFAPSNPSVAPTIRPTGVCDSGWTNYGNKCYKESGTMILHDACVSYCTSQRADATLLCIENADQNAYIVSQFTTNVWLSYNDVSQEGNFVWGAGCESNYSNWRYPEPNDGVNGNFVYMFNDGRWIDTADGPVGCECEYVLPHNPSTAPSVSPTIAPSAGPTLMLTSSPSADPTAAPTKSPSCSPSVRPSTSPSAAPTLPTATLAQIQSSPTYTVRNAFAFAVKAANGDVYSWGEAPHGGNASSVVPSSQLQGVAHVVPSRYSFAARKGGKIAAWGLTEANLGGAGILSVVANEGAFAGFDTNGKVYAWGSKHSGGDITNPARCPNCATQLATGVTQVIASAAAFAAMKTDGSVFAWGSQHSGGDASPQVLADAAGAVKIVAARSAFAALLPNGGVVTWGDSMSGGDSSSVQHLLVNIVHIVAAPSVFVAFRSDLSIVTWGYGKYGGDSSQALQPLTNVVFVAHTLTAMAALKSDGTVVTWGVAGDGGNSTGVTLAGIQTIHANSKAFVAVKSAGGLVAWGKAAFGGSGLPSGLVSGAVTSVHHTDRAFLAVKQNEEVVVWGQAGHGGSPDAAVRAEVGAATGLVHTVCSNEVAFSVLTTAGKVVAWGHPVSVPVPGVQFMGAALTSAATCA